MVAFIEAFLTIILNYNKLQHLTINGCLRLAAFLTGLRVSALPLWLTWFWLKSQSLLQLLSSTAEHSAQINSTTEMSSLTNNECPVGLATLFYCLRFETYIFVSSYDSQVNGGVIRPRLHSQTHCQSQGQSQSYFTTDGLPPISSSWCRAPWDSRPELFFSIEHLRS
jgi:hypothetical protein